MIQPIYLYGSEVLRRHCEDMDISDKEAVQALLTDLKDTLATADGCGLAAPQIGVPRRVVIVDGDVVADTYDYLKGFRRTLINFSMSLHTFYYLFTNSTNWAQRCTCILENHSHFGTTNVPHLRFLKL